MFVLEFIFSQALIFVAFGVGLDPRQANVFGAALSPILVGLSLALGTLAASLVKPGYTGVCKLPNCQQRMMRQNTNIYVN